MSLRTIAFLAMMIMLPACSRSRGPEIQVPFKTESAVLETLPPVIDADDLTFSPDGTEAAYKWTASDGRQGFAINGRVERYYDEVGEFIYYTRDGTHYAYRARKGPQEFVVFDGTEGAGYDKVTDPVLAATGRALAYAAKSGEEAFIVFGNKKLGKKEYDLISPPLLSADGRKVAYRANRAGRWFYVVNGKEGPLFDELDHGYFSRDGRSFVYAARRKGRWTFVKDGKEGPEYDEVSVFPDAADDDVYTAVQGGKSFVVFRGRPGPKYDDVGWPAVSPDGRRVAYEAKKDGKSLVVFDGEEGKVYDLVGRPVFSPDGKEVAYDAVEGESFFMVRNGGELRDYIAMPNAVFSSQGGKLAYSAVTPGARKKFVVEEGIKGREYDRVSLIAWSANSRHLAYAARDGEKEFLVVDGREGKTYERILSLVPRFSRDGKFVGANALKGREVWWAVEPTEYEK